MNIKKNKSDENTQEDQPARPLPMTEYGEDEIELWKLAIPLLRYKVQLIVFLLLSLGLGFGFMWSKHPESFKSQNKWNVPSVTDSETLHALEQHIDSLASKKESIESHVLETLDTIENDKPILEIKSIYYRYKMNNGQSPATVLELNKQEWIDPLLSSYSDAYELILEIESTNTSQLKSKYKALLNQYFRISIEQQLAEIMSLELAVKLNDPKLHGLQNLYELEEIEGLSEHVLAVKLIKEEKKKLAAKISYINISFRESNEFELEAKYIPNSVWNDLNQQFQKHKKKHDKAYFKQSEKFEIGLINYDDNLKESTNLKIMFFLLKNDIKNPLLQSKLRRWQETLRQQQSDKSGLYSKYQIVIVIISILIAVGSVYFRVTFNYLKKISLSDEKRSELYETLRCWKW